MTGESLVGRLGAWALLALLANGCAPQPEKPSPVPPQITEETLRNRAREQVELGVKQFNAGEFDAAQKSLQGSLDHGLLTKPEQSSVRKYLAFVHCVSAREAQCREEFRKAFEINADFALTPAEDGHPIWGPVYRNVRAQLIAQREASVPKPRDTAPKAEQMLAAGLLKYDSGEYAEAIKLLEGALKEGLREKPDQVRALKHIAFCLCLDNKWPQCRATFMRIYDVNPDFDLTPAEAGHPSWTKTFAQAKAQARAAIADKAAKEKAAKDKAAPPPPKKN